MSIYAKQAAETGDKFLAALAASQDNVIKYVSANRPMMAATNPAAAAAVQTTRQLSDASFEFASKLLGQQHAFFRHLYALQPSMPQANGAKAQSEKPAAKTATSKPKAVRKPSSKRSVNK